MAPGLKLPNTRPVEGHEESLSALTVRRADKKGTPKAYNVLFGTHGNDIVLVGGHEDARLSTMSDKGIVKQAKELAAAVLDKYKQANPINETRMAEGGQPRQRSSGGQEGGRGR